MEKKKLELNNKMSAKEFELYKESGLKNDEYVGKDGHIYCKNCNTMRSIDSKLGGEIYGEEDCDCKRKKRFPLYYSQKNVARDVEIKNIKERLQIGERYIGVCFETTDQEKGESFKIAFDRCKKYADNWENILKNGYGIYLYGSTGTGKTHLASCIANKLANDLVDVYATSFIKISQEIKNFYYGSKRNRDMSLIYEYEEAPLLIIDDVGVESVTKNGEDTFMQETIYSIIDARYRNKLPTILTSNFTLKQLIERGFDQRTIDRIRAMTEIIEVKGINYRATEESQNRPSLF